MTAYRVGLRTIRLDAAEAERHEMGKSLQRAHLQRISLKASRTKQRS